jgi:hypothetical protein
MARQTVTFTSNTSWTVPSDCYILEVFLVGGGGGGGSGGSLGGGGGGGGGRIIRSRNVTVSPGQVIGVTIGAGGDRGAAGGTTLFGSIAAAGGSAGIGNTGAGGASSREDLGLTFNYDGAPNAGGGASPSASATSKNGAPGYLYGNVFYSGGGGGGINLFNQDTPRPILPGFGGSGGGASGGSEGENGNNGISNTGGGAGGGASAGNAVSRTDVQGEPNPGAGFNDVAATLGGFGGSGIVIVSYDEATFELSTSAPGVAEGSAITLTLRTRNVTNGSVLGYTITGSGITDADFNPATLTGSITVSSGDNGISGTGSAVITTAADLTSENDTEFAVVFLNNGFASAVFLIGDFSEQELTDVESRIIAKGDYNVVQEKVARVLGASTTAQSNFGWGQIVQSAQVSESTRVGVGNWNLLRNDIVNSWVHLFETSPSLTSAIQNTLIRANLTTSPYAQYDSYANVLLANRFGTHPTQSVAVNKATTQGFWPGEFGLSWNTRIYSVITASWPSAKAAREFFNSGGEVRFNTTRIGGAATAQNSSWTSLLLTSGTRAFGGNKPGIGTDPNDGSNYFKLTDSYQTWYTASSSNPYSTNTYRISARSPGVADNSSGTAASVEFIVELLDNYTAGGGAADAVDGDVTISVTTLEAIGSLIPSGTGNFTVQSPTVTVNTSPRP